jgi:hypothetical protein
VVRPVIVYNHYGNFIYGGSAKRNTWPPNAEWNGVVDNIGYKHYTCPVDTIIQTGI